VLLLALLSLASRAAAQTVTDERLWINVVLQSRADRPSPWRWSFENIVRARDHVTTLDVVGVRPMITYVLNRHSSVGGGYAWLEASPATKAIHEQRLVEQYVWTGALSGGALSIRSRVEQRFVEGNSGVAWRVREQVRFSHPVRTGSRIAVVGYDELFVHLNTTTAARSGIEQNRAFAGIADVLSRTARFEVGYVNQFAPGHGARNRMNHVLSGALIFSF